MKLQSKNVEAIYPLSPLQEGMLFHSIYLPDSGVYVTQISITLHGHLNVAGFKQAWAHVASRHSIFRTLFVWEGVPKPHQVVRRQVELPWTELDWRILSESDSSAQLAEFLAKDQAQGFQLNQAPLMRFALIQATEERYHFVWSHHHILIDGWSLPLVFKELLHFYTTPNQSLPRPRPYQEYIKWLQKQDQAQAEAYWRQALQGITRPTPLPLSLTRPQQPEHFAEQCFELAAATTTALQGLSREHRLTVNSFVQGAWALLLSRYSGEEEVLFGAALSSRPPELTGMETMVGLFLNNLPVRVQVEPNMDLLAWLQRLQAAQVEREQFAHTPLVDIQGWSNVPRSLPLFESHVAFESYPLDKSSQEQQQALHVSDVHITSYTNSAIVVRVIPGDNMSIDLIYDAERFEAATIQALGEQFVQLLSQFVAQPHQKLADYSLLTPAARSILPNLKETLPEPPQVPITTLFAAWADQIPEHPAIEWEDQQKDYRTLYADAQQIAHEILATGMQKGEVVAVYGERHYGTIASMMGVLLSGSVLLNIAHNLPIERQRVMLREAGAKLLLNVGMNADALEFVNPARYIDPNNAQVTRNTDYTEPLPLENQFTLPTLTGNDSAYIFFTSGTTGVPKGVLGNHKGLAHFLKWQRETFAVQPTDRCAQLTALSFDVVLRDIFMPLTSGATLCLPEELAVLEPARLLAWLAEKEITLLHTVPSVAQSWMMEVPAHTNNTLRWAFFAGEPLTDTLARRWYDFFTASKIANIYGPTETTLAKCWYHVPDEPLPGVQPVGRPLPQTQAFVLDEQNRPCGIGEQGEIVIRTPFRTDGYINVPPQQSHFAPNPRRDDNSDLLYYTGDQGRYRADGTLDILGRIDEQVKIRGIRIELGEIKAILEEHADVWESVVIAQEDETDREADEVQSDKKLVAYIVPVQQTTTDYQAQQPLAVTLRNYLVERLPETMIPSAFVTLDKIPLTSNGKIDRRALPVPSQEVDVNALNDFVAPRTETEETIAAIWCKILKCEEVSIYDNFFAIGGHSLMATQVVGRLRRTFDIEFSLHDFFDEPTIVALAELVEVKVLEEFDGEELEELLEAVR